MSISAGTPGILHPGHDHDSAPVHGAHPVRDAAAHGSRRSYLIGFLLSVVLTAIPFWLVMSGLIGKQATGFIIAAFAMGQVVVHMIYFLHMNARSEGGWIMMALIFTIIMVVITLAGSLWVMHHLDTNMMPAMHLASPRDAGAMP